MPLLQISKYSASGNDFVIFHTFIKKDRSDLAKNFVIDSMELGQTD